MKATVPDSGKWFFRAVRPFISRPHDLYVARQKHKALLMWIAVTLPLALVILFWAESPGYLSIEGVLVFTVTAVVMYLGMYVFAARQLRRCGVFRGDDGFLVISPGSFPSFPLSCDSVLCLEAGRSRRFWKIYAEENPRQYVWVRMRAHPDLIAELQRNSLEGWTSDGVKLTTTVSLATGGGSADAPAHVPPNDSETWCFKGIRPLVSVAHHKYLNRQRQNATLILLALVVPAVSAIHLTPPPMTYIEALGLAVLVAGVYVVVRVLVMRRSRTHRVILQPDSLVVVSPGEHQWIPLHPGSVLCVETDSSRRYWKLYALGDSPTSYVWVHKGAHPELLVDLQKHSLESWARNVGT